MSWRTPDDLGLEIVSYIHQALKVENEWCIDSGPRGFTWWSGDFAQHVWSEESNFYNSTAVFKIHAETDLIRGHGRAQKLELPLMTAMRDTSLCGVVYDKKEDVYRLHSSVYMHADNLEVLQKLLAASTVLQLDEAHTVAHEVAKSVYAEPALSEHPHHGLRSHPSPMVNAADLFFRPSGRAPSRWLGCPEWKQTEWAMERESESFQSDHRSHLSASFAWPRGGHALLDISAEQPHPLLGTGLTFRLSLPPALTKEECAHKAVELNARERSNWLRCHFLGSWCFDKGALEFECFVPNTSYNPDLLLSLTVSMAVRAQWASEVIS